MTFLPETSCSRGFDFKRSCSVIAGTLHGGTPPPRFDRCAHTWAGTWRCAQVRFYDGVLRPVQPLCSGAFIDLSGVPRVRVRRASNPGLNARDQITCMAQAPVECRKAEHVDQAMQFPGNVKRGSLSGWPRTIALGESNARIPETKPFLVIRPDRIRIPGSSTCAQFSTRHRLSPIRRVPPAEERATGFSAVRRLLSPSHAHRR